jgi:hypothetical protein
MSRKIAIIQSNYIPWKGYFDIINQVDEFVLFDDMQYTRRDWRNRNKIKTPQGLQWLSVPVEVKGKYFQKISETQISEADWGKKHWKTIHHNYSKAPGFDEYAGVFENYFNSVTEPLLSNVNFQLISLVNEILGIKTKLRWSSEFELQEDKTERLVSICQQAGATEYISGPAAREYMDLAVFEKAGIAVDWADYSGYPEYPQLYGDFEHGVTILDLLFNTGKEAKRYMKSFAS